MAKEHFQVGLSKGGALMVWIPNKYRQTFKDGARAEMTLRPNGSIEVKVGKEFPDKPGKRIRPSKATRTYSEVECFSLGFGSNDMEALKKLGITDFKLCEAHRDTTGVDPNFEFTLMVPEFRRKNAMNRKHTAPRGRSAPRPQATVSTAIPSHSDFAAAIKCINAFKAHMGDSLEMKFKTDGSLRATILQEFE